MRKGRKIYSAPTVKENFLKKKNKHNILAVSEAQMNKGSSFARGHFESIKKSKMEYVKLL